MVFFSIGWMIASFLPLPRKPQASPPTTADDSRRARDIEKALGPVDYARYENARWWRNINRTLAFVGVLLVAAIVSFLFFLFC